MAGAQQSFFNVFSSTEASPDHPHCSRFIYSIQYGYCIVGNFRGRNFHRSEVTTLWRKLSRNAKTYHRWVGYGMPKFCGENFAGGSKIKKFVNVFSLESFRYMVYNKLQSWNAVAICKKHINLIIDSCYREKE